MEFTVFLYVGEFHVRKKKIGELCSVRERDLASAWGRDDASINGQTAGGRGRRRGGRKTTKKKKERSQHEFHGTSEMMTAARSGGRPINHAPRCGNLCLYPSLFSFAFCSVGIGEKSVRYCPRVLRESPTPIHHQQLPQTTQITHKDNKIGKTGVERDTASKWDTQFSRKLQTFITVCFFLNRRNFIMILAKRKKIQNIKYVIWTVL